MNAASSPKKPPALMTDARGAVRPAPRCRCPMASSRNARSRKKKSRKKATVERSVMSSRMVEKMNQP